MSGLAVWLVSSAFAAIALALYRLLRGPSQADRVVALDVVFSSSIVLAAAAALESGRTLFLDVAIGLALFGFVTTLVWSRLIERSSGHAP